MVMIRTNLPERCHQWQRDSPTITNCMFILLQTYIYSTVYYTIIFDLFVYYTIIYTIPRNWFITNHICINKNDTPSNRQVKVRYFIHLLFFFWKKWSSLLRFTILCNLPTFMIIFSTFYASSFSYYNCY